MAMNDPLGDMLTRIRNAYGRKKTSVSTPASRLRARVLDVMKSEGYIRDYATIEHADGRTELEIELKYFDGEPVIREIARVSKPGRRVYASVKALPRRPGMRPSARHLPGPRRRLHPPAARARS